MDHDIPEIDTSALYDPTITLTSSERGRLLAINVEEIAQPHRLAERGW